MAFPLLSLFLFPQNKKCLLKFNVINPNKTGLAQVLHLQLTKVQPFLEMYQFYKKCLHLLTFSHIAITGHRAFFSSLLTRSSCRKTYQANTLFEVGFSVQFQNGNVVVQSLRIVIMMYVRRGYSQSLGSRTAILLCQIMVTHSDVDGVTGSYNAGRTRT